MLKLRSRQESPPGGWWHVEDGIRFVKTGFNELVIAVTEYLKGNEKKFEGIADRIEQGICQRWPQGCQKSGGLVQSLSQAASFVASMTRFVSSGGRLVEQAEANRRAIICAPCHNNVQSGQTQGCRTCRKAVDPVLDNLRAKVLSGRHTSSDNRLNSCYICGCPNVMQVWMPLDILGMTQDNVNAYPAFCWKKQL